MILFRLILKEYFKFVGGTVTLCILLFTLFDMIHKASGYFSKHNPAPILIVKYYIYQMPFQLVQTLPMAALLGSVIVMVLFCRTNEITAMRTIGMDPFKIAAPLGVGGLILTCFAYFLSEVVIPKSSQKVHHITSVLIEGQDSYKTDDQAHWIRDGDIIFNFSDYNHSFQTLSNLKIVSIGYPFYPRKSLHAGQAAYNFDSGLWTLTEIHQVNVSPDGVIATEASPERIEMKLPISPEKLGLDRRKPDEIGMFELSERIRINSQRGMDVLSLRIAWHVKLAYPLASFLISLLGIKFGYRSERSSETVRSILLAFGLGISYWFLLSTARALAGAGDLHPFLAGWLANIIIFILIALQFFKLRKI